jgi:hypothetical protein
LLEGFRGLNPWLQKSGAVIAGFIRYIEFLTSLDALFPEVNKFAYLRRSVNELPEGAFLREQIAQEIIKIIQWKIPIGERAANRYTAVRVAFFNMVRAEFERYPESGLHFSIGRSESELARLSYRFFDVTDWIFDETQIDFEGPDEEEGEQGAPL